MGVRELALQSRYDSSVAYYPGLHSGIDPNELSPLSEQICRLVTLLSDVTCSPQDIVSDFSVVTTRARDMLAMQKHPHVDPVDMAGIVYLNPGLEIGTSMFRHLPLGLAALRTEEEYKRYHEWLDAEGERTQPETYAIGNDGIWGHLHTITGKFNRLAMYPGNFFHSIAMSDVAGDGSLNQARLTQRIFIGKVTPYSR